MKTQVSYQGYGQELVGNARKLPTMEREISVFRVGFWLVIGIITLVLMVQIGLMLYDMNIPALLANRGDLTGVITDQSGHALAAEITVQGTQIKVQADASGRFTLEDLPSGKHSLVVNYHGMSGKYLVQINAGSQVDMGKIKLLPLQ